MLAHRGARVRGDELQRRRVGGRGRDHRRIVHGTLLGELVHHLGHGGLLLSDGHVNAKDVLPLLVDDRIHRDGRLPRLPIADDQLPLSAADGYHGVNGLQSRLQRFLHGLPRHDPRGLDLDPSSFPRLHLAAPVDRLTQSVHDASHQRRSHRHLGDPLGPLDEVPFLDVRGLAHDRHAHVVLLQVQDEPVESLRELDQFTCLHLLKPVDTSDAVSRGKHHTCLADLDLALVPLDLALDEVTDLACLDLHGKSPQGPCRIVPHRVGRHPLSWPSRCESPVRPLRLALKRAPHAFELRPNAPVEDEMAHLRREAADEGGVDLYLQGHLLPRSAGKPLLQAAAILI